MSTPSTSLTPDTDGPISPTSVSIPESYVKAGPRAPGCCSRLFSSVLTLDADSVVEYDFRKALFGYSFYIFLSGGVMSKSLAAYLLFVVGGTLLTATASCAQAAGAPPRSYLLGERGCWRNVYATSWSDITLMTLTSFLLALLVNNVHTRWWTCRSMVQDLTNSAVHVYFQLHVGMAPSANLTPQQEKARVVLMRRVERRLRLAFNLALYSASTDADNDKAAAMKYLSKLKLHTPPSPPRHNHGRYALLTDNEMEELSSIDANTREKTYHRHTHLVLGWLARDVTALCASAEPGKGPSPHVDSGRLNDLLTAIGRLRTLSEDLPMQCRVQLPFATVSMAACVVHLTIIQIMYTSASYIGAGLHTPEMGTKALAGLFSVCVLPAVFLSILKLQALLSNPFGKLAHRRTNFPVRVCTSPRRRAPRIFSHTPFHPTSTPPPHFGPHLRTHHPPPHTHTQPPPPPPPPPLPSFTLFLAGRRFQAQSHGAAQNNLRAHERARVCARGS